MNDQTIHDRRWWTLSVLCLSLVIIIVGNTVLNVAIPTLIRELDATQSQVQWMVDSYALVFAGLLLICGALGDRFGRKRALNLGLVIFGLASLASTTVETANAIIATRAVMGVGAAFVMPATLPILANVFPPHERAKAIGIWAGLSGAGAAIGPIAGGYLLEHFYWGSIFFLNVPIVIVALVAGRFLVPNSRDEEQTPLDPVGAALSVAGLGALLYAIIEAPNHGWGSGETIATFIAAAVLLTGFAAWELTVNNPMLDLRYFKNPRFSSASSAITLVFFSLFGSFFLLTQYLQFIRGYSALGSGVRSLPFVMGMVFAAPSSVKVVQRFGPKRTIAAGLLIVSSGLAFFSTFDGDTAYPVFALAMLYTALGMGTTVAPATTSIMSSLPLGKAGVGSAVNDTTRELGGALGVAVLGSVVASAFSSKLAPAVAGLPEQLAAAADSSLGGALQVAASLPTGGTELAAAAREAFVEGMSTAFLAGAAVTAFASVMVMIFMPSTSASMEPIHAHQDADEPLDGEPVAAEPKLVMD